MTQHALDIRQGHRRQVDVLERYNCWYSRHRTEKSDSSAIIVHADSSSNGGFRPDPVSKSAGEKQGLEAPPKTVSGSIDSVKNNEPYHQPPEQAESLPSIPVHNEPSRYQDLRSSPDPEPTLAEPEAHTGTYMDQDGYARVPPVYEPHIPRDRVRARRKLIDTFAQLTDKRERILPLRLQLHDLRASLRSERTALNSRDAQLIQRMRVLFSKEMTTEFNSLLDDFTALQEARDQLQPEEEDYNKLEDRLIREEWELQEAELKIYGGASAQISNLGDEELAILEETFEDTKSTLSTHSGPAGNSQQVNKYLSRKGDANIVRERLDDLRAERAELVEEEIRRARVGLTLDEHSRAFLTKFDANHKALQQELAQIEEDVLRLKQALVDDDEFFFSTDQFDGSGWEIVDVPTSGPTQRLSLEADGASDFADGDPSRNDPLLLPVLPVEEDLKPVFSKSSTGVSKGLLGTANYINQWLLHRLRRSLQEVRRFMSIGDIQRLNLSQEQIKDLALEWWFKDQSVDVFANARKSVAQSANLSTQASPGLIRDRETKSDSQFPTLRETVLHARRDKGPLLHLSDSALPVQVFAAQSVTKEPTNFPT